MENHCPHAATTSSDHRAKWIDAPVTLRWYRAAARNDRAYERTLYRHLDAVICTTRGIEQRVRYFAPDTPALLLHNGAPNLGATIPPYDLDQRSIDIIYVGKTSPEKGTDLIIRAMEFLPEYKLNIVGGPAEEDMAPFVALSEEMGILDRVVFQRWLPQKDVLKMMCRARVAVHPLPGRGSREWRLYTCPLKILEYMAAGTPIVCTRLPSICELIRDGENGVLVTPGDPEDLARGVRRILEDSDYAERLRRTAFEDVKANSTSKRAEKILQFLGDLIRDS